MLKTAVFTIVSKNYWSLARTLMQSLAANQPGWERHVLLADRPADPALPDDGLFTTSLVEDLDLPKKKSFLFRYTVLELNTAVKPWMFGHLRKQGYQRIIYLDPDILVLKPLQDVERLLEQGASAVVTPHLTAPLEDNCRPSELDIMRSGSYNLGFLALGNTEQSDRIIRWWQQKLEYNCVVDLERGLFTDQKWMELIPGMFEGVSILRKPGYNAAYWNLAHRKITSVDGEWLSNGEPLRFFHFSGFNPEQPGPFSKHQDRFTLNTIGQCKELTMQYAGLLLKNGYKTYKSLAYAFNCFDDGTAIPEAIRVAYRENPSLQHLVGDNPFAAVDLFTKVPSKGLPPLLIGILQMRKDLSVLAVPDMIGKAERLALMDWFLHDPHSQHGIPEPFIQPIRAAMSAEDAPVSTDSQPAATTITLPPKPSSLGGLLEFMHHRMAGSPPSYHRLQQYRSIRTIRQFISLGSGQFRRYLNKGQGAVVAKPPPVFNLPQRVENNFEPAPAITQKAPQGVNLFGYACSEHGVGESLRLAAKALHAVDLPHLMIDFNAGNLARTEDKSLADRLTEKPEYSINISHVNADQTPVLLGHFPEDFFAGRYNIGFWHWELPEFPDQFLSGFNGLNEVWVPTSFVHGAVAMKSPVPVIKIPHAIDFAVTPCKRADFELPEDRFLFLTMYDFSSYQPRKNPKAALDAFDRAFGNHSKAMLVIKTQNSQHHPEARQELENWLAGRDNVVWLDKTLTRQEIYNLESLCDCFLSLHRSEGFGLGPAEAMFLGKPVVATNWSGNTEFMRQDNSLPVNYQLVAIEEDVGVYEKGQLWADPDLDHASWLMRQLVEDGAMAERIGRAARQSIKTELSPTRIGNMILDRLRFIQNHLL